jgi:uncharacterized protein involved in type VI secretion and phage assembly
VTSLPTPVDGGAPAYFGVYPALVTDIVDNDNLGRIEVRFPWLGTQGDADVRAWATLCTPYADSDQGLMVLPEVGSQVVVAFEAGNLRRPYVIGASWNGQERQPFQPAASNDIRLFRSRAGSRLEFDDRAGAAKVTVSMASGHSLVLDDAAQTITVRHAAGSTIKISPSGIQITTSGTPVDVTAPMVNVNAAMAKFSGVVQCQSLVTTMVTSPAYTPGAGNIW